MRTDFVKRFEVHTVYLEEGIDYQASDLVQDIVPAAKTLPAGQLNRIARAYGFDRCCWSGNILLRDINRHQLKVQFERSLKG